MGRLLHLYASLIINNKKWFIPILIVFFVGLTAGFFLSINNKAETGKILAGYAKSIDFNIKDGFALSWFIFERNVNIILFATITGFFLGLPALTIAFINGSLLGVVIGFVSISHSLNPIQLFLLLFPHGIFEYTGSVLGLTFGFKLGVNWLRKSSSGHRKQVFLNDFKDVVKIIPVVIIILFVAALIEGNLTGKLACFLASACPS